MSLVLNDHRQPGPASGQDDEWASPEERKAAAQAAAEAAAAAGTPLSGAELGRRFDIPERTARNWLTAWARDTGMPRPATGNPQRPPAGHDQGPGPATGNGHAGRPPATAMPAGHRQPLAPATGNTTGLPAGRGRALPAAGHRPTRAVAGHARPAAPAMTAAMTLWLRWLATVAVVLVAGVAAATSYEHQHELLLMVGETGWRARLLPLSVDGLMVAASLCLLVRRNTGKPARLAWLGLVLGGVVSVAANIATAEPTIVGRLVAAWPPIAFALAYELLMQLRTEGDQ